MSERNRKSFFGGLFNGSEEKKDFEKEAQKEILESSARQSLEEAGKIDEEIEKEENLDPLEKLKVEESTSVSSEVQTLSNEKTLALEKSTSLSPAGDYSEELARYQKHQHDYEENKKSYDKILDEYENLRLDLEQKMENFSVLNQTVSEAKNMYDTDFSDFQNKKEHYNDSLRGYKFASKERQELFIELEKLRNELTRRQAQFKDITESAKENAQQYEDKANETKTKEADLKAKTDIFNTHAEDMELLAGRLEELQKKFDEEEPKFAAIKDNYDFVTQVKNEYETVSKQYAKMQMQEDVAKVNFDEIQTVLAGNQTQLEIASRISNFTVVPLSDIDTHYLQEKEQFTEIEQHFTELKERYDTESANFARIEKNYADLSNSDNANRVALHYVTEEYNGAKDLLNRVLSEFLPVEKAYNKQKAAFEVIDANYEKMSEMVTAAKENLEGSQRHFNETQTTYKKVAEAYDYIQTQNEILKTNLATKEGEFRKISDDYDHVVAEYQAERQIFDPLDKDYHESLIAHENLRVRIDQAEKERDEARQAYDSSSAELADLTTVLAEIKKNLDSMQEDLDKQAEELAILQKKADDADKLAATTLTTTREQYVAVSEKYQQLLKQYDGYSEIHSGYNHSYQRIDKDYQKVSSLYRLASDEFESISKTYQGFVDHGARVSEMYSQVKKNYESDKDYYDQVFVEYEKVRTGLQEVTANKQKFDLAATHLKSLLIQDQSLTFPIYEATGHNYVDNFNLPTLMRTAVDSLSLKEKPQLEAWLATYESVRTELSQTASQFADALSKYQKTYDHYLAAGGERLLEIDHNRSAYSGIDLTGYVEKLDQQIADWRKEYTARESAFAVLLNSYTAYLDREKQLLSLVSGNTSVQEGIQAAIALINSIPDYTDMYSPAYGDINQLALHLGIAASELTKPRAAEDILQILRENYYQPAVSLIRSSVSSFVRNLNTLKSNYDESLSHLHKEIQHFQITTGISTDNIHINGIINNDFDFERYLDSNLAKNYDLLRDNVSEVSSLVNVIRRVGAMGKVANRAINTTADNTLVLGDKPITMSESLLNTEVKIYSPRNIPIPIEPDEPTAVTIAPRKPISLKAAPDYVYQVEMPENVAENIEDIIAL